ncbi:MAG: hypothetical protein ACK4GC_05195 [Paracoccaceae bacterium]
MTVDAEKALRAVRQAVLDGDYVQLSTLLPELEQGEADLHRTDLTTLHRLTAEAERTATCLQSALSGVRAARRRAVEITKATQGLTTYDRDGVKATVPASTPTPRRV